MNEGKAITLAAVLRFEQPFKSAHIYQLSGLSRELTRYHLMQFVKEGFLEKTGVWFSIINRDGLFDLIKQKGTPKERKMRPTNFMPDPEGFNNIAEFIVAMRALDIEGSLDVKKEFNTQIDAAIEELQNLKHLLTHRSMTDRKAAKVILEADAENFFDYFIDVLGSEFVKSKWVQQTYLKAESVEQ